MASAQPFRIDVWSDIVCPWCWIGKHRLDKALQGMGPVEVRWHPFLLDPQAGTEPEPLREAYAAKFGSPERVDQLVAQTQGTARAEGLPMDFDRGQVRVSTLDAHRVAWLASREGADPLVVGEALFRAHFEHGRNLADPQVLADAGEAGGLPRERTLAMLASEEGTREVHAALAQAGQMGIRAVPTFVLDGKLMVQGAQAPEVFRQAFAQVGRTPLASFDAGDAAACGPDGCTI